MSTKKSGIAPLDAQAAEPFYRQIYARIRAAIAGGVLKPGDRIPSARALMQELGLARGTVDAAYALLAAEGYVVSRGQAGTVVTPGLALQAPTRPAVAPAGDADPRPNYRADSVLPFQMGLPALDAFPRKLWARLGARCARTMQPSNMTHPPAAGLPDLRRELASYLHVARGIRCTPSQIFVTSGYRHTMQLICAALLAAGDRVWVEDPGYPLTRDLLAQRRVDPVPVPVDQAGMSIAKALALAPDARAAIVTPAHQSPLCVTLSLPRRLALLDWAGRNAAWIVEDDYDGEYRYVSRPLPALKSLDRDGRVLYAGTFSKVLFPGLRLAYLVVPDAEVARFEASAQAFSDSPYLTQAIVAAFMAEGHFARHIQRMRKLYAARRAAVTAGLEGVLGKRISIDAQPGGMHLVVRLQGRQSDRPLAARMRAHGLCAEALSGWSLRPGRGAGLLLNFTNIDSEATAGQLARRIAALL